ncbi:GAD-like domain-containing protein [Psychromonas sp. PT13]|uniref:GAD-like domain-containing protein n=1 Tax=Psychromonas sp. PT13 TaxID=3439547 RepID=UPI003EBED182
MNRYIDSFLDEFEEPQNSRKPDIRYINTYVNKLPKVLLKLWEEFGFCSFLDGLFSVVDPEEYKVILEKWFTLASIDIKNNKFHVIAKSGYGDLFVWDEVKGRSYEINAMNGWIIKSNLDPQIELEKQIGLFFATKSPYSLDIEDDDTNDEMFESAVNKLGPLESDEIFGFIPTLVAGGDTNVNNLQKVNIQIYLDLILQFDKPKVITIDDLAKMAY